MGFTINLLLEYAWTIPPIPIFIFSLYIYFMISSALLIIILFFLPTLNNLILHIDIDLSDHIFLNQLFPAGISFKKVLLPHNQTNMFLKKGKYHH